VNLNLSNSIKPIFPNLFETYFTTIPGAPFARGFVERLMREIAAPVFAMIRRWVFEGELLDPHAEFFVAARTGVKEVDLWQSKYVKWVQMDDVG
jgi:hypothetical protein